MSLFSKRESSVPAAARPAEARPRLVRVGERTFSILLQPLPSSLLEAAGHDGHQCLFLAFRTLPGSSPAVMAFPGVSAEMYEQLRQAKSPGNFYASHIWPRYPSEIAAFESESATVE